MLVARLGGRNEGGGLAGGRGIGLGGKGRGKEGHAFKTRINKLWKNEEFYVCEEKGKPHLLQRKK